MFGGKIPANFYPTIAGYKRSHSSVLQSMRWNLPLSFASLISSTPNGTQCHTNPNRIPSLLPPPNEHGEPYPKSLATIAITNPRDRSNDGGIMCHCGDDVDIVQAVGYPYRRHTICRKV